MFRSTLWSSSGPFLMLPGNLYTAGFEVLTAVVMKSTVFWDITPCSPLKVNRHFGGAYRLHLKGRTISQARYQRKAGDKQRNQRENRGKQGSACHLLSRWFLFRLFRPWRWMRHVLPKLRLNFKIIHGVISQKIAIFNLYTVSICIASSLVLWMNTLIKNTKLKVTDEFQVFVI
jgi:hypothetical protein